MMRTHSIHVVARTLAAAILLLAGAGCAGDGSRYPPAAECPQPRFTGQAPPALRQRINPLPATSANLDAGRALYAVAANPACRDCHGASGGGNGPLAGQFDPRPRNFSCAETVDGIPDGQLAWIVRNGSPGTAMPAFAGLSDDEIWQVVLYLRTLVRR